MGNIIEVDFRRRDDAGSGVSEQLEAISAGIDRAYSQLAWYENQLRLASRYRRRLELELAAERKLRFPFTDDQVHAALAEVGRDEAVSATAVARRLFSTEPSHSAVIRVGHALGRLATAGRAVRLPRVDECGPYRWKARA